MFPFNSAISSPGSATFCTPSQQKDLYFLFALKSVDTSDTASHPLALPPAAPHTTKQHSRSWCKLSLLSSWPRYSLVQFVQQVVTLLKSFSQLVSLVALCVLYSPLCINIIQNCTNVAIHSQFHNKKDSYSMKFTCIKIVGMGTSLRFCLLQLFFLN